MGNIELLYEYHKGQESVTSLKYIYIYIISLISMEHLTLPNNKTGLSFKIIPITTPFSSICLFFGGGAVCLALVSEYFVRLSFISP